MSHSPQHADLATALKELLQQSTPLNQQGICTVLTEQGFEVNQSRISRLLRKIGAIKIKGADGRLVYRLPKEPEPIASADLLEQLVLHVQANENLVVIHTHPGSASMVARLIDDHADDLNVLGAIAGDDTVFVTPDMITHIAKVETAIKKLLAYA